jgi:hypothetical protein
MIVVALIWGSCEGSSTHSKIDGVPINIAYGVEHVLAPLSSAQDLYVLNCA